MKLENHKKQNTVIEQKKPVKHEYKFIGSVINKKGCFLFALDIDNNIVYKVDIQQKKVFHTDKKREIGKYIAHINPKHPLLYAINIKNAVRKFSKKYNEQ